MDERQVKAAVLMRVREACGRQRKPIITAEFSLGSSGVRADLVAFSEETIGFEIKTSRDTLRRLSSQMEAYARYFNHVVAIVAPSHLPALTDDHVRGGSVWTYDDKGMLSVISSGTSNIVDEQALQDLLTQAERRKSNFRDAMRSRYAATSDAFWQTVSRRSIRPNDLSLLSRFADNRARARQFAEERDTRWSHWLAAQGCLDSSAPSRHPNQSSSVSSALSGSL